MSCYLVNFATIDVLVNAAQEFGVDTGGLPPRDLGAMLWAENTASYGYRYGHCLDADEQEAMAKEYVLTTTEAPLHPVVVAMQVANFEYQSCEHPAWRASQAKRFCDALVEAAEARMPAEDTALTRNAYGESVPRYHAAPLWKAAPWGVEHVDEAAAHRWTAVAS